MVSFFTNHIWLLSLNNRHIHEISLFFVLPTYVKIILIRWLHNPIVTKLCWSPWNRLYTVKPGFPFAANSTTTTQKTKRLCAWAVILPTNRFVLAQNWSLSWSKLAQWKPGLLQKYAHIGFEPKPSQIDNPRHHNQIAWQCCLCLCSCGGKIFKRFLGSAWVEKSRVSALGWMDDNSTMRGIMKRSVSEGQMAGQMVRQR